MSKNLKKCANISAFNNVKSSAPNNSAFAIADASGVIVGYKDDSGEITTFQNGETYVAPSYFVDLGLPSGILWATMYCGANSETEFKKTSSTSYPESGGRLPTIDEFRELFDNTTQEVETIDGKLCVAFYSNTNDKKIIFATDDEDKTFQSISSTYIKTQYGAAYYYSVFVRLDYNPDTENYDITKSLDTWCASYNTTNARLVKQQ